MQVEKDKQREMEEEAKEEKRTFTLEHSPGQTRLVLSGLLGNQQGA